MNDPSMGISVAVVAQVFTMLVTLLFLAMNGHLVVLEVLVESFNTLPIGETLAATDFEALVYRFSWVMASAILIGLPAIAALLIVNLSFGVKYFLDWLSANADLWLVHTLGSVE